MQKIFIKALMWNSSTTFIYKITLLSHQILLYSVISNTLYGLQSTLFAVIYTIIALTNFGFEETLLPFFSTFTQSKQQFHQILLHFLLHFITINIVALLIYLITLHGSGEFLHNVQAHCNKNFIIIAIMIFIIESLKKTLIAMMQLAFLNKEIACAEITMLIMYIASVWTIYGIRGQLELHSIFLPMLIASSLEFCYLFYGLFTFYQRLPVEKKAPNIPFKVLFKQRIYNYVNQISKTIYSPNSMTIFFAYFLGFQQAATIKFFTNIITLCYTFISKTIGVTTGAAFSAMNKMPLQKLQSFFKDVTKRYFQMLLLLTTILAIVIGYSYYQSIITGTMSLQIILFFSISLLEHVSITYEQFFMSQHATWILTIINMFGLSLLIGYGQVYLSQTINLSTMICIFISTKIISLWTISFLAKRRWNISFFQ